MARIRNRCKSSSITSDQPSSSSLSLMNFSAKLSYLLFLLCFFGAFVPGDFQTILLPSQLNAGQENNLVLISNKDAKAEIQIIDEKDEIIFPGDLPVRFVKGKFYIFYLFLSCFFLILFLFKIKLIFIPSVSTAKLIFLSRIRNIDLL